MSAVKYFIQSGCMGLPQVGTESIGEDPLQMPPEGITYNSGGGRVVYTKKSTPITFMHCTRAGAEDIKNSLN